MPHTNDAHTGDVLARVLHAIAATFLLGQVAWGIDFSVQRGVTDITGTTATITAGVDYTAPSALSNAFIRITNTRLSGGGRTSLGGNQNAQDWMVSIQNPGNLLTSITFERFNATNDTRVWWEIVEFTNIPGSPNEFIVRDQAEVNLASGTLTTTGAVVASIADDNDVAVFITGQRVNAGNTTSTQRGLHYSSWLGGPDQPQFDRQDATGNASRVSYAVVEFTGANWSVEYSSVDFSLVGGTSTTSTITGVGALSRIFLHVQNGATQPGLDDLGVRAWPSSATVINWDVQFNSSQIGAAWAIGNTDTSAGQMSVQHFQTTDSTSADGAIESFAVVAVTATNASAMGESARSTGAGTASPRGSMNLRLQSGGSFYDTFESDNGQTTTYALSVVEWPEDLTPVANADSYTGLESTDIVQPTLGVLSNDAGASPRVYRLQGTLLGGFGPLTQASSQGGSVTITSDGAFTYDDTGAAFLPLAFGVSATDTFTYTNEAFALTDQATVTLTITGISPPTAIDDSESTRRDTVLTVAAGSGGLADDDIGGGVTVSGSDNPADAGGSVNVAADGSFTYDPTGVGAFSSLMTTQTATDTFSYFIANIEGTDTGEVTVLVQGTGIAVNDIAAGTTEDASSTAPNVLTNDIAGSTTVEALASDQGASLSIDTAGNFTYDPTTATLLQALATGATTTDVFVYRSMNSAGVASGWDLQFIDFNASTNQINNTIEALLVHDEYDGDAEYFLASTGARYHVTNYIERDSPDPATINYGGGNYGGDLNWPDGTASGSDALSDIVMRARVGVEIPAGTYTIAFGRDDGGMLRFQGNSAPTFDSVFSHSGAGGVGTQQIRNDGGGGHNWTGGTIRVTSTTVVEVFALFYERGGGDSWEISLASGAHGSHNTTDFALLADSVQGWNFIETDSATVSVTVTGVNDAPTGTDDRYSTDEDTLITGGSGSYLNTVNAINPILHWRLGESSGLTAADASGNNRDGLIVGNGVTLGATGGIISDTDGAFDLAGTDDFVTDEDAEDYLNSLSAVSFEMWVEADAVGGTERGIFGDATSTPGDSRVGARYDTSGAVSGRTNIIKMAVYNGSSSQSAESSQTVGGDAVWSTSYVHLVMTWSSGNNIRFFVNGVEDGALAFSGGAVSGTLSVSGIRAGFYPGFANEFDGAFDEFAIYASALTPAEVLANYTAGLGSVRSTLIANDDDPDNDVLSVASANGSGVPATFTSGQGAEITVAADGSFTYDPTESSAFSALETGETLTDNFVYVAEDTSNATVSLTAVIVVAGVSGIEDDSFTLDEDTGVIGSDLLGRTTPGTDNDNGTAANDHAPGIGPTTPYSLEWFGNDQAADDADASWESSARAQDSNVSSNWTFGGAVTFSAASDARFTALETAVQFPVSGNGGTMGSWDNGNGIGNPTNADFSLEIVFQADNVAGNHILWETGGATDGSYIALLGNTVEARSQDSGNIAVVTSGGVISAGQFYHLFYTFEIGGVSRFYLDGALIGTASTAALGDWAGADAAGLGQVNGSIPSAPGGLTAFDGDIGLVRYYDGQVVSPAEIANNFAALTKPIIVAADGNSLVAGTVTFNTAGLGVSVTLDSDGAFTYDALGAAAVQALDAGDSAIDSFTYESEQSGTSSNSGTATVTFSLTGLNDAPSVSGTGTFTSTTEESTTSDLVSAVVGATITDPDASAVEGIALIASSGNGTWQYDTGGGFTTLPTINFNTALLLRDTDSLRYIPDGLNGEVATVGYHAWDQTSGTVGLTANPNPNGGTIAFSTTTQTANLIVTSVNDAPVLDNSGSPTFVGTNEDTATAGELVATMLLTGAGGDPITDVDNLAVEGIAISAISGNGTWQFDTGSGYTSFPAVNANTVLLLRAADSIRYVPDPQNAETAFMTFLAWDQFSGTAGQTAMPTPAGGTTAFSTVAESASLAVSALNDAPVLDDSDAPVFSTISESQTLTELVSTMLTSTATNIITDVDVGAIEGIGIIGFSGNGTWQYNTGGGFTTLPAGLAANSALLLRDSDNLRYIPDGLNGETATIIFRAWDRTTETVGSVVNPGAGGGTTTFSATPTTETAVLTVTDVNDAPSLDDSGTPTFTGTDEDTTSVGDLVSAMLATGAGGDPITDSDTGAVEGVAIYATAANGTWQYDTGGGYTSFPTVNANSALLLRAGDSIRFVPDQQNGETGLLTFYAWDRTSGTAGTRVSVATRGGSTAFSTEDEDARLLVTSVNDAPTLDNSGAPFFLGTTEDTTSPSETVATMLARGAGGDPVSDVDTGAGEGVAITAIVGNGTWQYDTGSGFTAFPTVNANTALLLRETDSVRYVPDNANGEVATMDFQAWDQASGTAGNTATPNPSGGTTAFSTNTESTFLIVTAVNDAPVLDNSGAPSYTGTDENTTSSAETVATMLARGAGGDPISDVDTGAVEGIAITAFSGNGTWQYDTGAGFTVLPTVNANSAFLLRDSDSMRYVPDNANGETAFLTFQAWDRSTGTVATISDASVNGGTTAFSSLAESAFLVISHLNDAPVVDNADAPTFTTITEDQTMTNLVSAMLSSTATDIITDVDNGSIEGVLVLGISGNGTWQYDTGGGFTTLPTVNANTGLLLRASDSLQYIADMMNGETAFLTFRAWDQTADTVGTLVNAGVGGGTTAYSTSSEVASLTVTDVNDAPVLDIAGQPELTTITEDETATPGDLVSAILATALPADVITDVDNGAVEGIAISAISGNGTWQYDTGSGFTTFPTVNANTALLLRETDTIRYVPDTFNGETAFFTFKAWDQTTDTVGTTVDPNPGGGTTAYSTSSVCEVTRIIVTDVNDAPVLDDSDQMDLTTITEDDTLNTGDLISVIIASSAANGGDAITDVDNGSIEGIAIIGQNVSGTGTGTWQFSTDGGATWVNVGTVSFNQALLLRETDRLRVLPDAANATTGTMTLHAWDQAFQPHATKVNLTFLGTGGTTAFSNVAETDVEILVTRVNDPPTISGTGPGLVLTDDPLVPPNTGFPFATVTIDDIDAGPPDVLSVSVSIDDCNKGSFSVLSGFVETAPLSRVYTFSGIQTAATSAIRGLIFKPTEDHHFPTSIEAVTFTIDVDDNAGGFASDNNTTVDVLSINDIPEIRNTTSGQTVNDNQFLRPFEFTTVTDIDNHYGLPCVGTSAPAQVLGVSVILDDGDKGELQHRVEMPTAGLDNDIDLWVTNPSPIYNGYQVRFLNARSDGAALATWNSANSRLDVYLTSNVTCAFAVVDAINAVAEFSAELNNVTDPNNNGSGVVSAQSQVTSFLHLTKVNTSLYVTNSGNRDIVFSLLRILTFDPTEDRVPPPSTETTTLTVRMTDQIATVSDSSTTVISTSINNAPVIPEQTLTVSEDAANGTNVTSLNGIDNITTFLGSDVDPGHTAALTYALRPPGGSGAAAFALSAAGVITVLDETLIDFETNTLFKLEVVATDPLGLSNPSYIEQKLVPCDPDADDFFGSAVAIDGNRLVIGAKFADGSGTDSGAAYVYERNGLAWRETARLVGGGAGANFGSAVGVSADRIAVGAEGADTVYVFRLVGTFWVQEAVLTGGDTVGGDFFGSSLDLDGGVGDTLVVGAPLHWHNNMATSGGVYVFARTGTTWFQQTKLVPAENSVGDLLGADVAVDGDTVAAGAPGDDTGGVDAGSVSFFFRSGGTWTEQKTVQGSDSNTGDQFGSAVDLEGDLAVIGAPLEDEAGFAAGAAYIFERIGSDWNQQDKVLASDAAVSDRFGSNVAITEGVTPVKIAIGSPFDDDGGTDSGSVYLFEQDVTTKWTQVAKEVADDAATEDRFGARVALSGKQLLIGANFAGPTDEGAAYVVNCDPGEICIVVIDANDPPVVNDGTFTVDENSPNLTSIGTLDVSDPDVADTHNHTITSGNASGIFALNAATGEFTVANSALLDFESTSTFVLGVQVVDSGVPSYSDTATVTITLNDINEAPVAIDQTFTVDENELVGFSFGTLNVVDQDTADSLSHTITAGNSSGGFALNINTGELTVADSAPLDFELTTQFVLSILVVDNGVPTLSDTASVTIDVNDLNEAPVATDTSFTILETVPNLTVLGTLGASDEDVGQSLTFSITAGNTGGAFSLGAGSGILTVIDNTGFEATGQYVLSVDIADNGGTVGPAPPLTTSITVTIDVTDVNDAPVITPIINQTVDELVALALVAAATDVDLPPQNLTFSIDNATSTLGATINPSTGAFDWTPSEGQGPGVYTVSITVTDDGSPVLSDTTVFDITVADVNSAPNLAAIGNKSATEGIQLTFTAVGGDTDQPTQNLTYSLIGGPAGATILGGSGLFSWTPNTTQGSPGGTPYVMSIRVTDDGVNPANLSTSEQITITVFEPGAAVGTSVAWTNVLGIDVQPNNDLERFILDEPGENRTFHSGAISVQCILGDNGFVETTVDETNSNRMFGLSDDNDQSQHFSDIKYAIFLDAQGQVTIYEGGGQAEGSPARPYVSGDILRVEIIGTSVHYSQNGVIFYTSTRPVVDSDYPFKVDVSMQTDGSTLRNVVMSPQVPASPKIISFSAEDPLDTDDSYGVGDTLKIGFDIPTNQPGGAGVQNKTAVDTLFQFSTLLGNDYQGQWQNSSCFVVTILDPAGHSGVAIGATTVEPLAGGTAILDATAASAASNRVSGLLLGDFGTTSAGTSPVTWQNFINATATPQSNDLTEVSGNDLLFGAAVSVETFDWGDITVEFVPEQTDAEIFVGLTSLVANNTALYQDIRFAAELKTNGTFGVSELPHFEPDYGIGRYAAGDRIKVAITGTTVTYYVNDILRYTSTVAVTPSMYPFAVDVAVGTGTITNVRFNTGADTVAAPPLLSSVVVSDPSGDDRILDPGDIITINLTSATNQPGGAGPLSASAIADLFTFSDPIASNYTGGWTTPSAFTITISDTSNSGLVFDETTIAITGTTPITDVPGTSGNADPSYGTVLLDGSFGAPALISGSVTWENIVNAIDSGGGTLTKTSTANVWNAYADSTSSYLFGDIIVEMTVSPTLEARMFGLNKVGEFDHPDIADFGIKVSAFNTLHVVENLADQGSFGSVRFGDVLRIEVLNGQVFYKKNDVTFYTSPTTLTTAEHYPLEIVGAIFSGNGILNGVSASTPPSAFPPEIDLFQADDPDDLNSIYSNDDTLKIRFDKPTAQPGGTGVQLKTAIDNLFTFSVSLGSDYEGQWTSASCFQITLVNIVAEGGVTVGQTTVTPAGITAITDLTVPPSPPASETSPLLSGHFGDPREPGEDVVWTNLYNLTANGNDLCKPDHAVSELASGAVSVQEISRRTRGTAYLEFDVDTLNHERVVGLTTATNITSRSQIEFGAFLVDQRFFVIERGVIIGQFGTYNVGEIIRVEYTANQQILYYVNGLLRYTSAVTINVLADLPMRAGAYIESAGAKVVNARVSFPPAPIAFNQEESTAVDFLLRITMDRATDQAPSAGPHGQATVDQLWTFTEVVGNSYVGEWTSPSVYCISVTDETGSTLEAGVSTVTAAQTIEILDDTPVELSPAANGTSPTLTGPFDETEDGRPIDWTSVAGASVGADNTLTKTALTGPNNAGAISTSKLFFGDGFFTFEITDTDKSYAIGWANSDPNDLLSSIDYAFYVNGNNANIAIFEHGATVGGSLGAVTPGDIFRIELAGAGGEVIYKKNGVTIYSSIHEIDAEDYPYHVDAVLDTQGAALTNVRVSLSRDNQPVIKSFTVRDPDEGDSVYSNGDVFEIKFDRNTNRAPNGDGNILNRAEVDDLFGIANVFTVAEDFGNNYQGRWINASCFEITALDVGDNVGIELRQLSVFPAGFTSILDDAGTSTASERPFGPLSGNFGLPNQIVWVNHRNVAVNGSNLEKVVQLDVASDWSAGAHSTAFLTTGYGYLETRVEETDNTRMIGWTSQPPLNNTDNHIFTTIDYAAFLNNSELWLWVAPGRYVEPIDQDSPVTLAPNDIVRVEINSLSNEVRFLVNGNLVHTLDEFEHPAFTFPMRVRASLEQVGATIKDAITSVPSPQVPVLIGYQAVSNGSGTVEAGDIFQAVFDIPTDEPFGKDVNRLETSEVNGLFHFNGSIGAAYDGRWTSPTIFSITVLDATGANVQIGTSTIKARALSPDQSDLKIRNAAGTSTPANTISPALTGAFRSAVTDRPGGGASESANLAPGLNVLMLELVPGWNLVSVPAAPLAPDIGDVFGEHVTGSVLTWTDGDYSEADSVAVGRGYWLYHGGDGTVLTIPAAPFEPAIIDLADGWNLIGVPESTPVPDGYRALHYQDGVFTEATTLEPYRGYWLHTE